MEQGVHVQHGLFGADTGARANTLRVVFGVALGLGACLFGELFTDATAFTLLCVGMAMVGAVYLGFAAADGREAVLAFESLGILAFMAIAAVALVQDEPWLLAAGYAGHAAWDLGHHRRHAVTAEVPGWYIPMCLGYDLVVAAYVVARFAA